MNGVFQCFVNCIIYFASLQLQLFFFDQYLYGLSLFPQLGHQPFEIFFIALHGRESSGRLWLLVTDYYLFLSISRYSAKTLTKSFGVISCPFIFLISDTFPLNKDYLRHKSCPKNPFNFRYCWDVNETNNVGPPL